MPEMGTSPHKLVVLRLVLGLEEVLRLAMIARTQRASPGTSLAGTWGSVILVNAGPDALSLLSATLASIVRLLYYCPLGPYSQQTQHKYLQESLFDSFPPAACSPSATVG